MWKTVLAGTTALAIAGTTLAYAQHAPAIMTVRGIGARAWKTSTHSAMRVSPRCMPDSTDAEQEKNWPAVENALGHRQAALGTLRGARQCQPAERSDRADELARRCTGATRCGAEEARRCGRPALQEPGRGAEAPLHHAGASRRRALRSWIRPRPSSRRWRLACRGPRGPEQSPQPQ